MSDRLKEHIDQNRASFEVYKGDYNEMWKNIDVGRDSRAPIRWGSFFRIAASIVLLLTFAFVFIRIQSNTARFSEGVSLGELSPELAEAELYYNMLVDEKMNIIKSSQAEIGLVVFQEFQMLDSAYNDLKNDLKDNVDNEEVINAMIQNYRIKLRILGQILENIQDSNRYDDSDDSEDEEAISI